MFDKKAWMAKYNRTTKAKSKIKEWYIKHRNTPEYKANKSKRDKRYRLKHLEEKRQKDREYFYKNREYMLERFRARIKFQGRTRQLKHNPRTGVCSLCRRMGRTDMHHMKYDSNDILAHTIELCDSCHMAQRGVVKNE